MSFVQAKCPECGGMLAVDADKKAAVCQFCGEAFIVQEAINNYNTYNETINNYNTTHNYSGGTTVNVYEDKSKDFVVVAGVLKAYHGESINVVIPNNVVSIGPKCFAGLQIKSIYISASVRNIDDYAFEDSELSGYETSIESIQVDSKNECFIVDNGVLINKINKSIVKAINSIVNYVIPKGIVKINSYAFANCKMLKHVSIPDGVETIGAACFKNCESLLSIELPDGLTEIGISAFENCKAIKEMSIPKSVRDINSEYFKGCNLNSIKVIDYYSLGKLSDNAKRLIIPSSVLELGCKINSSDFDYNSFKEVEVIYDRCISEKSLAQFEHWQRDNVIVGASKEKIEDEIKRIKAQLKAQLWKRQNLCQYCGGYFTSGFLGKQKCINCGRKKDY